MFKKRGCFGLLASVRSEVGSASIVMALSMPIIVASGAFGVETSYWYYQQLELQAAADSSAYAGAIEKRAGSTEKQVLNAATQIATTNGYEAGMGTLAVNSPPKSGPNATAKAVEVLLTESKDRYFTALFLQDKVKLSARAVAVFEDAGSACVLALHKSKSKAANFSGSSTANFINCSVTANSLAADAINVQGSGKLSTSCLYSSGGAVYGSGLTLTSCKKALTNLPPVGDPFAGLSAPPTDGSCKNGNSNTLQPGVYCGGLKLNNNANKTLNPGVYVISGGDLQVNAGATLTGSGVMFYLTNGARVSINGNATVQVSAATSGAYSGMLFFGDRSDTGATKNTFNGTADSKLTGAIYFANQDIQYNGNFSGNGGCTQVVGLTVEWNGNANVSQDCSAYGMKNIPATQMVRLAE